MSLWHEFGDAVARDPLLVAVVVDMDAARGLTTVEFPNGSQLVVRGTGVAVGGHAFVRAGEIRGVAPAVVPAELEV
ncbi:hypothetical protein V3391_06470 [Luteimonas sp. SMYT11W]|uniref:Uncharacterized protein n=1 Tax=Luteimonas flava TaxID=3115822 RepID=A0ABU7WD26_9GAMM